MGSSKSTTRVLLAATLAVVFSLFALVHSSNFDNPSQSPESSSDGQLLTRLHVEIDPSSNAYTFYDGGREPSSLRGLVGLVSADDEVNINDSLQVVDLQTPAPGTTNPGSIFPITPTFTNVSANTISDVFFRVAALEYRDGVAPHPTLEDASRP